MEPILIVGAGPTGLTAAIELRRFGLPVRLIDKSDHPARWSQALGVQARTLEQFERYGIAAEAVRRGRPVRSARFHSEGKLLGEVDLSGHIPGHFPFVLCLPQNETEEILTQHLRTLGVEIERGVELTGFSGTANGAAVTAHLRHADGRLEHGDYPYLLGCDGAHSRVRSAADIPFTGDTLTTRFALGDITLEGPDTPGGEISLHLHHGGEALFLIGLPSGEFRVIEVLPAPGEPESRAAMPPPPTLEDFNAAFQRFGLQLRATAATWLAPFRVNERKAERYRQGRAFLLGDAGHIHSPAGGQGMNTGIQDAANLCWKLAAVLGGAPAALLDTYDEERGAVARAVLAGSGFGVRFANLSNPLLERLRDFAMRHALRFDTLVDHVAHAISQTAVSYRGSSAVVDDAPAGPLHAGDRMPDLDLPDGRSLLSLLQIKPLQHAQHLMVAIDVPGPEVPRNLKNTAVVELHAPENRPDDASPAQAQTTPLKNILGEGPLLYLIRPDGYIGFRGAADGDRLRAYAAFLGFAPLSVSSAPAAHGSGV